jgi:tripartite-type tricarboxylate transporter receptor subunit TctC
MAVTCRHLARLIAALLLGIACASATAQAFPDRPVRMLVPFSPGGPTDLIGRLVAQHATELLGKTMVVDNRAGAGGLIAVETAVKAAPDGYTVLFGSTSTFAVNPALSKQSYDVERDLKLIAFVAYAPQVLVVRAGVPAANVAELIALSKKNPGKLTFASSGVGTTIHLAGELLKHEARIDLLHVPYKGGGPAISAMLSGEVDMIFNNPGALLPYIKGGRFRALAVAGPTRSIFLPDVPTFAEAGYANVESGSAFGLAVPARTPAPIAGILGVTLEKLAALPQYKERLAALGTEPLVMTRDAASAYVRREYRKWSDVAKAANVKMNAE